MDAGSVSCILLTLKYIPILRLHSYSLEGACIAKINVLWLFMTLQVMYLWIGKNCGQNFISHVLGVPNYASIPHNMVRTCFQLSCRKLVFPNIPKSHLSIWHRDLGIFLFENPKFFSFIIPFGNHWYSGAWGSWGWLFFFFLGRGTKFAAWLLVFLHNKTTEFENDWTRGIEFCEPQKKMPSSFIVVNGGGKDI